jgi:epoxyqueuosine reductase
MPDAAAEPIEERLRRQAFELGFDDMGITSPDAIPLAADRLRTFLAEGMHGEMSWMADNADRRSDPRVLWPEVRAVVMVGLSYAPAKDPLLALSDRERAIVSVYAKGRDYHDVLKNRLKQLAGFLATATCADVKVFVDTAPLMEKPLAAAAGLGWQGKHTNLVSRRHGSWLFLGAILTTARLEPDDPETDHCGSCRRCLDICPTAAFPAPYRLDARRCLAYLTIEHKGHIPQEFRAPMGNRVFGCDDCLAVCPWNKFAEAARETRFAARVETDDPPIAELLALDDAAFRARFAGTPVKRTGRDRVVRNALIAAGNSGDPSLFPAVSRLAHDPSPLVRAMAAWAAPRLGTADAVAELRHRCLDRETDDDVRAEWEIEEAMA